eukprot:CAMPEP_0170508996 /NCGR_PEP_ID=MMETSP0208-20121228/64022_1 /TAXON_ID=197538 /ORGANISM="Strombidium inclinatum, Strain S3" /LENGTH=59 /DNA_ID=CAMNT_0010792181 /DNA_START=1363 /DNA_END=1542 /DNA_ORIENTATION=-
MKSKDTSQRSSASSKEMRRELEKLRSKLVIKSNECEHLKQLNIDNNSKIRELIEVEEEV